MVVRDVGKGSVASAVVEPEQDSDGEEGEGDRDVGEAAEDQGELRAPGVGGRQQALDHVLIGAMGRHREKGGADDRRKDRVGLGKHGREGLAEGKRGVPAELDPLQVIPSPESAPDGAHPAEAVDQEPKDERDGTDHEARLDQVGPDDRLDPPHDRVEGGDECHKQDAPEVGGERHRGARKEPAPDLHEDHPAEVEPHADAEDAGEKEDPAGRVFGSRAEAHGQELVDALHAVLVVGADEGEGDHDAGDHGADRQLPVEEGARLVPFGGSSQEGRRACLRRHDRGQDGPPRDGASAEREFLQRRVAASRAQADPDDQGEVGQDDRRIDPESPV